MNKNISKVAGMSMKSGRSDDVAFSLLTNHGDHRWFLTNLIKLSDDSKEMEVMQSIEEVFVDWPKRMEVRHLILDVPLSLPPCHTCKLNCPGLKACPVPEVKLVREEGQNILQSDQELLNQGRKLYEEKRVNDGQMVFLRDHLSKNPDEALLSKSFKRRLKKEFLPYWNRPLDFWVWQNYYDVLLALFKYSFDSFGQTSFMSHARMNYLMRHLPSDLHLYESHIYLIFIEMLRAKIVDQTDLLNITDYIQGPEAKLNLIKKIEEGLGVFVYDQDLELIIKDNKCFQSFILSCAGVALAKNKIRPLPTWARSSEAKFIVPEY